MTFLVTARKYRPQSFDEVIGQEHVIQALKNAILNNRIGHAYLFSGTRGVGKTTIARIFAKSLNCVNGPTITPCQKCNSCVEITKGTSLDVKEIDGASNRGIDAIRDLKETISYPPARDRFKIYIIDEVHMLTQEAFNALLKTLEEPPPYVKFIFATTEPQKVPETILSRVQRFDFQRLSVSQIVQQLQKITEQEGIDATAEALRLIAVQAEGSMRDAESYFDQVISFAGKKVEASDVSNILRIADRSYYINLFDGLLEGRADLALEVFNKALNRGISARSFIKGMASFLADTLTLTLLPEDPSVDISFSDIQKRHILNKASQKTAQILLLLDIFVDAADRIVQTSHPDLVGLSAIAKAALIGRLQHIDDIIGRLKGMKVNSISGQDFHEKNQDVISPSINKNSKPVATTTTGTEKVQVDQKKDSMKATSVDTDGEVKKIIIIKR